MEQLLRITEVMEMTTLADATIYKLMKEGEFPRPIKRGKTSLWLTSEIEAWIQSLKDVRDRKVG